jgi:hypothetical protein
MRSEGEETRENERIKVPIKSVSQINNRLVDVVFMFDWDSKFPNT